MSSKPGSKPTSKQSTSKSTSKLATKPGSKKSKKEETATSQVPLPDPSNDIGKLQEELKKEKEERNYYQLERDKIHDFWQITQKQLAQLKSDFENKDREMEELEEKHQAEIKVYKQKVKHLLYEYQNNLSRVQLDSEKQIELAENGHHEDSNVLKKQSRALKLELIELELSQQEVIKNLKIKQEQELTKLRFDFDRRCKELYGKYAYKTKCLREDLELRRKNELHELEERKNAQINTLMKNHEKSFSEIKNYYNDITLNNLALINSLKEQVEEMKKKEDRNERLMNEVSQENKRLKEPLEAALAEGEHLKKQLKNYEKDKMALTNSKARVKALEGQNKQLAWEKEILEQRYVMAEKERDALYRDFTNKCKKLEQKVGLKNLILEKKMAVVQNNMDKKDLEMQELMNTLNAMEPSDEKKNIFSPQMIQWIQEQSKNVLQDKESKVEKLQKDLSNVVKQFNQLLRVYEERVPNRTQTEHFKPLRMAKEGLMTDE